MGDGRGGVGVVEGGWEGGGDQDGRPGTTVGGMGLVGNVVRLFIVKLNGI